MSWILGVSDYTIPDFSVLTDEQMLKLNLNTELNSIYEIKEFEKELEKRGLVEKRIAYQKKCYLHYS